LFESTTLPPKLAVVNCAYAGGTLNRMSARTIERREGEDRMVTLLAS
jgi:hypothetical protein